MISKEEILAFNEQICDIASFSEEPEKITRRTFSDAWFSSLLYLSKKMRDVGMDVRVDGMGNLVGTYFPPHLSHQKDTPIIGMGSHIDTVTDAGAFDGVAGIVAALDVARRVYEHGEVKAIFEVVAFAEEEGARFDLGCLGSRYASGDLSLDELSSEIVSLSNSFHERFQQHDISKKSVGDDIGWMKDRYASFFEVHVEQGPFLYERSESCALVTGVVGIRRMLVTFIGEANHAGTTQMHRRKDSLVMASEFIRQCWDLGQKQGDMVLTNGKLINYPNQFNVVSGRTEVSVEIRGVDDSLLDQTIRVICRLADDTANDFGGEVFSEMIETIPVRAFDSSLLEKMDFLSGGNLTKCMSWADHDTKFISYIAPAAMIFVASKDGISHNPQEMSDAEDLIKASQLVFRYIAENY